ncbi:hypothetical protein [Pseudomonas capsici]|uniref:hypothetical protein n=1 Tax=Pseudomonas capsici TaxID=2810614 RepID=UPI0021F20302|nr:hypothetical protein [Pseudomonas capsici]MCV4285641.1 hypothetical protein [Pseudomonas capsici]
MYRFNGEIPLKLNLSLLMFSLVLCAAAQAAPTAETEAVFQNAMRMAEANQQWLDLLIEQEQQGQADKKVQVDNLQKMMHNIQSFQNELRKASGAGHAVATYLLANMQEADAARHAEACALYQTAADQGLLAGAVTLLNSCEKAFQRFKSDDPELVRLRNQLIKALESPDPYSEHYPLPAMNSLCFKELKMPTIDSKRPLTSLKETYIPTILSFKQFRADGYYLLALKGDIEKPAARDYFKQVQTLAPDCLDPMSLGVLFNAMEDKAQ